MKIYYINVLFIIFLLCLLIIPSCIKQHNEQHNKSKCYNDCRVQDVNNTCRPEDNGCIGSAHDCYDSCYGGVVSRSEFVYENVYALTILILIVTLIYFIIKIIKENDNK